MQPLPDPSLPWPISLDAVRLIAESESLRLKAYLCPAGVWTIGWGETDGVHRGDTCTKEQADRWLCEDTTDRAKAVAAMCTVLPNKNELGALVSLAYNIGLRDDRKKGGLYYSSVLRLHNSGDHQGASRAFGLINKARNPTTKALEVLPGLTIRRAKEAALYITPEADVPPAPMPQAIEPESKLKASPINKNATVAAGTGVIGMAAEYFKDVGGLKEPFVAVKDFLAEVVGIPVNMIPWMLLIVAGIAIVYYRNRQRKEGWA